MKHRAVIEQAIGETRAAIYAGRRLVEFHLRRETQQARPKPKDIFTGRVLSLDPSVAGAFIDLGIGPPALLRFNARKSFPQLQEGLLLDVEVSRAAMSNKGPNLTYHGPASRDKVGGVKQHDLQAYLSLIYPDITFETASISSLDAALDRQIAVKGGGMITIEQTQALLAIDVDKGQARLAYDNCLQAASLIAMQLRLRGLGGLVAIDFPNLRQPKQRKQLQSHMQEIFAADRVPIKIAPLSRFGVIEMTRYQDDLSLDAKCLDNYGQPTVETKALQAIRRLEQEGKIQGGAQLTLQAPQNILDWLNNPPFDWQTRLAQRIGARFTVKLGPTIDVSADR